MKNLVNYAKSKKVEIIPEIDIPGHMTAILTAYPESAAENFPEKVATYSGIFPYVISDSIESLEFLKNIKDELKINQSFDDFKDDFESGMYADELISYFEETSKDFKTFYDDINDAIIFCIDLNDESIETKSIYELKDELRLNLESINVNVSYTDIDIFAIED